MTREVSGTTLVMLPGTLCDGRLFEVQKRALRRSVNVNGRCVNVHCVDYRKLRLPMFHQSSKRPYSITDWVQKLLAELPERFSLAGFSLGGIWALEILRQAPERVERLAMIASNAQAASAKGLRNSRIQKRLWRNRKAGPRAVVARGLPSYFHHKTAKSRHTPLLNQMAFATRSASALTQFAWAGTRPAGLQALSEFSGSVLIVSGAKDPLCPPQWQEAMSHAMNKASPASRWLALPRVGHFVPLEAPKALGHALQQWLTTPQSGEH